MTVCSTGFSRHQLSTGRLKPVLFSRLLNFPTGLAMVRLLPCAALFVFILAGCGGGGHPVEGKVSRDDGGSVAGAVVVFHPDISKGNKSPHTARGIADDSGAFKIVPDGGDRRGLQPGAYKVTVMLTKPGEKGPKGEPAPPDMLLPKKYGDAKTSGLTAIVPSESPDAYHFTVSAKDEKEMKGTKKK
jgi:hypothetical protein